VPTRSYHWILAAVVLVGGFVAGYAMSGGALPKNGQTVSQSAGGETAESASSVPSANASSEASSPAASSQEAAADVVHRFPLTAADVKETMETAAVAVTEDGAVHVAWASRVEPDKWQLFFTSSADRGETFATPRVIATSDVHRVTSKSRGQTITREVRMMPRLVSRGSELLLGWVEAVDGNTAVQYFVARSGDGGQTFSQPVVASRSEGARPTYTSLAVGADGRIAASWLDNRRKTQLPAAAVSTPDGQFESDSLAHVPESGKGVCPCCPTNVTFGPDGSLYLAFRNQQDGFRDMWISRLPAGATEFEPPKPVVEPTWQFDGCPHDGPSLAVQNDRLTIAWMDARSGQPRVYLGQGTAALDGFQNQEVDPAAIYSQGHPALAAAGETLLLAWDEGVGSPAGERSAASDAAEAAAPAGHDHSGAQGSTAETSRAIRFAQFSADGKRLGQPQAVAPAAGVFQSRPSVVGHPSGDIYVGWVELGSQGKSIAIARLKREPFPTSVAQDSSR